MLLNLDSHQWRKSGTSVKAFMSLSTSVSYAVNASVSAGVVSYRSWFRVALCTETSPGINDVSCVRVVKSSCPDSLSQRRVKIRSV